MNVNVKPGAAPAALHTALEPRERLRLLHRAKHGIEQRDISYAIDGYADDMLSDLVYGIERDLERQCEEAEP